MPPPIRFSDVHFSSSSLSDFFLLVSSSSFSQAHIRKQIYLYNVHQQKKIRNAVSNGGNFSDNAAAATTPFFTIVNNIAYSEKRLKLYN